MKETDEQPRPQRRRRKTRKAVESFQPPSRPATDHTRPSVNHEVYLSLGDSTNVWMRTVQLPSGMIVQGINIAGGKVLGQVKMTAREAVGFERQLLRRHGSRAYLPRNR